MPAASTQGSSAAHSISPGLAVLRGATGTITANQWEATPRARIQLHITDRTLVLWQKGIIIGKSDAAPGPAVLMAVSSAELVTAVKDVYGGGAPMTCIIARKVVQSFKQAGSARGETENLSPRERSVLDALAKGYNYKETADLLSISYSTVHTHIERIYHKLHVQSRGQAVAKYLGA